MRSCFRSIAGAGALAPAFFATILWAWSPLAHAGVPLGELLSSRAGMAIFGEMFREANSAYRFLDLSRAHPGRRLALLNQALKRSAIPVSESELSEGMERVYKAFSARNPERAAELFGLKPALPTTLLNASEKKLIQALLRREFDAAFVVERPMALAEVSATRAFAREMTAPRTRKLTPQERALLYWETRKNMVTGRQRSFEPVAIEHYEIPLELVRTDIASRIAPELRQALIFEREGRQYVRWVINPEDTLYFHKIEDFLRRQGIEPRRHRYFTAYKTASRSYVVIDPTAGEKGIAFSIKGSTNQTGGLWTHKPQSYHDALEARAASDYVHAAQKSRPFEHLVVMDEPMMMALGELDQALLVRSLSGLASGEVTYLPGFAALHSDLGARIARANAGKDVKVADFWNEHYNKPLGRALAELAARTGFTYDSPHSQNFLIEMIGIKPTGRIVIRDFGDCYVLEDYLKAVGREDLLQLWPKDHVNEGVLVSEIALLNGNEMPRWMGEVTYERWAADFYAAFEAELAARTGVPLEPLARMPLHRHRNSPFFEKSYRVGDEPWRRFFREAGMGRR
jgi:hypothetical protein